MTAGPWVGNVNSPLGHHAGSPSPAINSVAGCSGANRDISEMTRLLKGMSSVCQHDWIQDIEVSCTHVWLLQAAG